MKLLRYFFLLNLITWILVIFFSIIIYSEENPIRLLISNKLYLQSYFPQGWAFFTKNARDPNIEIFAILNGKIQKKPFQRQGDLHNLLGLKRDARAMGCEYGYLLDKVKNDTLEWTKFTNFNNIELSSIKSYVVNNFNKKPLLKDYILLIRTPPVPWAWSKNKENIKLPVEVIKLKVICR